MVVTKDYRPFQSLSTCCKAEKALHFLSPTAAQRTFRNHHQLRKRKMRRVRDVLELIVISPARASGTEQVRAGRKARGAACLWHCKFPACPWLTLRSRCLFGANQRNSHTFACNTNKCDLLIFLLLDGSKVRKPPWPQRFQSSPHPVSSPDGPITTTVKVSE